MATEKTAAASAPVATPAKEVKRFPATVKTIFDDVRTKSNGNQYVRMIIDIEAPNGDIITQFADRNLLRTDSEGKPMMILDKDTNEEIAIPQQMPTVDQKVTAVMSIIEDRETGKPRPFFAVSLGANITDTETTLAALGM